MRNQPIVLACELCVSQVSLSGRRAYVAREVVTVCPRKRNTVIAFRDHTRSHSIRYSSSCNSVKSEKICPDARPGVESGEPRLGVVGVTTCVLCAHYVRTAVRTPL